MMDVKFCVSTVKRTPLRDLIVFTNDRITNMEACADFIPEPDPTIENMRARRDLFATRQATYKANPSEINKQLRNDAFNELIEGHLSWMKLGEKLSAGDKDKALRLGYPLYAERTPAEVPQGVPAKPTFELTVNPGEIILKAAPYKQESKNIYYNWKMSTDNGLTYQNLPNTSSSHRRKAALEFNKNYYFKVAYATNAGEGPLSEAVVICLTPDMVGKPKKIRKKSRRQAGINLAPD